MLAVASKPCYREHLPSWARESADRWHRRHGESSSVPYTRFRSSRISRARQTMDDGGIKENPGEDYKDEYLLPPFNSDYARRRSCPQRQMNFPEDNDVTQPEEVTRPASACGFYKPASFLSPEHFRVDFPDLSNPRPGLFTRSTELLGSVRRSVKKYARSKMFDPPASTEPQLPSVVHSFTRGVSPDPAGRPLGPLGRPLGPGQQPVTSTAIFQEPQQQN